MKLLIKVLRCAEIGILHNIIVNVLIKFVFQLWLNFFFFIWLNWFSDSHFLIDIEDIFINATKSQGISGILDKINLIDSQKSAFQ